MVHYIPVQLFIFLKQFACCRIKESTNIRHVLFVSGNEIVYTILLVGKQLHLFSWVEDLKLCMSLKCNVHKINHFAAEVSRSNTKLKFVPTDNDKYLVNLLTYLEMKKNFYQIKGQVHQAHKSLEILIGT